MIDYQLLVPVLAGVSVMSVGGAVLAARYASRVPVRSRLRNVEADTSDAPRVHWAAKETPSPRFADFVGNIGAAVSSGKTSLTLREQLTQAGYYRPGAPAVYLGAKMLLLSVGFLTGVVTAATLDLNGRSKLLLVAVAALLPFFVPNLLVSNRRSRRRGEVRGHLPDAIDLLEVCASAGMGLDMAWNSVTDEVRGVSPILADEMALTNLEIHLGASRAEAMRHMARRTGVEELSSLVAVLVQSERFGTSVAEALRTYATSMRELRSQAAQETAEKMAVKLIFPMVVFIFPACVMVMAGPAFMALYRALATH